MKIKGIHTFAACRDWKADPAENAVWFQTFPPFGRYPVGGTVEGAAKDAEYVIDQEAADSVVAAFRAAAKDANWPGVLVDREHYSLDRDKPSDAMAWAKDIRQEADGSLWTRWEFTPTGRELWDTRTLVNRSPAFACEKVGKDYRPAELTSIGMTNTPHFKELSTLAAARAAEVTQEQATGEIRMKKLLEALGLGEGASEEEALAALQALKDKASAAEAKATEAEEKAKEEEAKCRKMACDAFIEKNKAKIADEAACREVYMASPDAAEKMIAACRAAAPAPAQTVLAAAKATPEVKKSGTAFATCREELASLPPSKRAAYYQAHKAEIDSGK